MIRILVFLGVLLAVAAGLAWLGERPGTVAVTWLGYRIETGITTLIVALLILAALAVLLWSLLTGLLHMPAGIRAGVGRRKRERGFRAISNGMVAVGSGDTKRALRHADDARRLLGDEPLALLLEAQAAQLAGDRMGATRAFERMTASPATRLLGLRGLYVEAQRHGDAEAARHFAAEASKDAPDLPWAGAALLDFQAQAGDWQGALATLDTNARHKLLDKERARRLKAVLLTARGLELEDGQPEQARAAALEAHAIAPSLVPAATLASRLIIRTGGDVRKAIKVLEATWKASPHPDVAAAYLFLKPGDSAQERLRRARDLAALSPAEPEAKLALARAAIDARDLRLARDTLAPLVAREPTRRTCLLMAELEDVEHGRSGRVREWLSRAVRAPRDAAWVADGFVSDAWAAVSPVSGKLDAFVWMVPPERLAAPIADPIDEVGEVVEEAATIAPIEAPRARREPEPVAAAQPVAAAPQPMVAPPAAVSSPPEGDGPAEAARASATAAPPAPEVAPAAAVPPLPDDPGPDAPEPVPDAIRVPGPPPPAKASGSWWPRS